MAELVYLTLFTVLSGAPNTQSACQTPKYCFSVGHVCFAYATFRSTGSPWQSIDSQSSVPPTSSIIYSTQTPFPRREKSAVLVFRTGDLSNQSQTL
jgi:hypothetical protein